MTLTEIAVAKFNAESAPATARPPASRGDGEAGAQLVAAAGLTAAEAEGMSLTAVAAAKFNRGARRDDWQPVRY